MKFSIYLDFNDCLFYNIKKFLTMKRSDLYSIFDNIIHLLLKDRRNRSNACDWHLD